MENLDLEDEMVFSYQTINFMMKRESTMHERGTEIQQSIIRLSYLDGEVPLLVVLDGTRYIPVRAGYLRGAWYTHVIWNLDCLILNKEDAHRVTGTLSP